MLVEYVKTVEEGRRGQQNLGRDVVPFSHCLFLAGLRTWIDCSDIAARWLHRITKAVLNVAVVAQLD